MSAVTPTLVSTFEILYTPQFPTGLNPPAVTQVDEQVVKGFFLTISNPNDKAYTFTLGFHCNTRPSAFPTLRNLFGAVAFLDDDRAGTPLAISPGATANDFTSSVEVAARGTVLVGFLPAFFTGTGFVPYQIESRGWVDITLPALIEFPPRGVGSRFVIPRFVPQSDKPVNVLLTPEQRLTFLPMRGDADTAVESQSAFALPLASGHAAVAVPPQPGGFIFETAALKADFSTQDRDAIGHLAALPPPQLASMLAALVAEAPAVRDKILSPDDALHALGFTGADASEKSARASNGAEAVTA